MMRAASALLVAVLLTTSTISGTFAKYVTTSEAKDEARVAKWGVELQVVGNLFGDTYSKKDANTITVNNDAEATVRSYNTTDAVDGDDVLAPGTKNDDGFTFSINGTPEVSGEIKIDKLEIQNIFLASGTYGVMIPVKAGLVSEANFTEYKAEDNLYYSTDSGVTFKKAEAWVSGAVYYTLEDKAELANNYYPVKFNLAGTTTNYDGTSKATTVDTLKAIADMIAGQISTYSSAYSAGITTYTLDGVKAFTPNTNLATVGLEDEVITWAWAFEGQSDAADTILGMLIAARIDGVGDADNFTVVKLNGDTFKAPVEFTDYCIDTKFELAITVTQVD